MFHELTTICIALGGSNEGCRLRWLEKVDRFHKGLKAGEGGHNSPGAGRKVAQRTAGREDRHQYVHAQAGRQSTVGGLR